MLSLRERQQIKLKQPRVQSSFTANIGDVVLIKDDLPRRSWRLGRIQELIKSRDGHIRSARVCLPTGKIIGRPLSLLFHMECQNKETNMDSRRQDTHQAAAMWKNISAVQIESKDSYTSGAMKPKRQIQRPIKSLLKFTVGVSRLKRFYYKVIIISELISMVYLMVTSFIYFKH